MLYTQVNCQLLILLSQLQPSTAGTAAVALPLAVLILFDSRVRFPVPVQLPLSVK